MNINHSSYKEMLKLGLHVLIIFLTVQIFYWIKNIKQIMAGLEGNSRSVCPESFMITSPRVWLKNLLSNWFFNNKFNLTTEKHNTKYVRKK